MVANNTERLTMTIEEAGHALGISRPTAYLMAGNGQLPVIHMGKRLLVPRVQLERLLAGEVKEDETTKL
jgi:excisionase family DNA binding protein